jgi:hypothetical protein
MNTYVVTFIPRCCDDEHSVEDVKVIISKANNKIDLITKLIKNNSIIYFVYNFIACSEEIRIPFEEDIKSQEILEKIKKEFDEQDIASIDVDNEKTISYIEKNMEDIVYLIQLYESNGCKYIKIENMNNMDDIYV